MSESLDNLSLGPNAWYVDELYELYLKDPSLVGDSWRGYFERGGTPNSAPSFSQDSLAQHTKASSGKETQNGFSFPKKTEVAPSGNGSSSTNNGVQSLREFSSVASSQESHIGVYRQFGHLHARINPLSRGIEPLPQSEDILEAENILPEVDRKKMESWYCGSIGYEFMHLTRKEEREWFIERIENRQRTAATAEQSKNRLKWLIEAEAFESELHRKYVGAKRFSLEGGETLMPMLHTLVQDAATSSIEELVFGMAHRGRLNVLTNLIGKPLKNICMEFEDKSAYSAWGAGDVKYHGGYARKIRTQSQKEVRLSLAYNPSHLEFVNPVVEGMARALQDSKYEGDRRSVLPVLIHGDAAFIGQGVVPETLNMARVPAYDTGGTIHIVINNQMGFTTPAAEARSSNYCTDIAKGFEAPIVHVNGEDIDACCWIIELLLEFRNTFHRDVVLDLYCWRKYGHNEGDDPSFTQPIEYSEIREKKALPIQYGEKLLAEGIVSSEEMQAFSQEFRDRFNRAREEAAAIITGEGSPIHGRLSAPPPHTGVSEDILTQVAQTLTAFPPSFSPHPKIHTLMNKRMESLKMDKGIDWGFAETLAFGSLKMEGYNLRLTGQDAERGTFSHRHLVLKNTTAKGNYSPLSTLPGEGKFEVYNSTLSETGVLGFEYGYSLESRNGLVLWEAQFGDFANGGQVIIDQFIAASEAKWNQRSGIILLLPHGYEGQGPEHSSARLERFLQLAAEGNMAVCYPTNGAQYFHLLRKQALSEIQRPIIVMTPKSLLRLPEAGNSLLDLTKGEFHPIIETNFGKAKNTILCSGKIYYDLLTQLNQSNTTGVKVIRIEQLYPFPEEEIRAAFKGNLRNTIIWVQEEPQNMGAWSFIEPRIRAVTGTSPRYIGRPEAASTADGSLKYHTRIQAEIVQEVIDAVK